jgi:hypothetical protein
METKSMTKKKVLLALTATAVLAFGYLAPAYAEDPPPAADPGAATDVPADPDSTGAGVALPDPGTDAGTGATTDTGTDSGEQPQK